MLHITLNTGHTVVCDRYPTEELSVLEPLIRVGGGPIPTRAPYRVHITRAPGGALFTIFRGADPITTAAVATDPSSAAELWDLIEKLYLDISDQFPQLTSATAIPTQPEPPWIATILLPAMSAQVPEHLRWIGTFEGSLARAIIRQNGL